MRVSIHGRNVSLSSADRARLVRRADFALSQFRQRVRQVAVIAKDENGDRGGVDKRCRVLVRVAPLGDIASEGRGESLEAAAGEALDRAARLIARGMGRLGRRRKERPSMSGEVTPSPRRRSKATSAADEAD